MKTAYLCPNCGGTLHETGGGFNNLAKFILIVVSITLAIAAFLIT